MRLPSSFAAAATTTNTNTNTPTPATTTTRSTYNHLQPSLAQSSLPYGNPSTVYHRHHHHHHHQHHQMNPSSELDRPTPSSTSAGPHHHSIGSTPTFNLPSRSHYHLSREEWIKGIANRFVFSQIYLYLYLSMAILSLTTVVLSLLSECPSLSFYILEIIVNLAMILEVVIRLVAFGKQFWKSPFNWLDLIITIFCLITVMVIFFQGCKAKKEEVFDTFLLVIRNGIQFFRLALMLRRSGKNIFTTIQPIDLEGAIHHTDASSFFLDLEEEEDLISRRPSTIASSRQQFGLTSASDSATVPFLQHADPRDEQI